MRLEEELLCVNKAAADMAFKKCSKEILKSYLSEQGFYQWKTNSFVRRNGIDLLEYVDLQKEAHGSKTFTVNYALMPLYVPEENMVIGLGDRLGKLIAGKDVWWDYADENVARISFLNIVDAIRQFLLPWFHYMNDEGAYKKRLQKDIRKSIGGYDSKNWLEAAKSCQDREAVIEEMIRRLKLPKNLG